MTQQEPLRKGQRTREEILRRSAPLFNMRGFAGASMADIVAATGIEKGGLYNHFKSKEELALAAFDYAIAAVEASFYARRERSASRYDDLIFAIRAFVATAASRPIEGGCPLLNTAIDADDTNPELRERTREVLARWRAGFSLLARRAVESGELEGVDPDSVGTTIVASVEGALMVSNVDGLDTALEQTAAVLESFLASKRVRARTRKKTR